jgi:hypothetical protein
MYNNQPVNLDPKSIFRTTTIIYFALLAGQLMFALVTFLVNTNPIHLDLVNEKKDILFYFVPGFALCCAFAGIFIFKKLTTAYQQKSTAGNYSLSDKLRFFQTAIIVRSALFEGAALFAIVNFLITGNLLFIIVAVCLMVVYLTLRPTVDVVADTLQLSYEEKLELGQ